MAKSSCCVVCNGGFNDIDDLLGCWPGTWSLIKASNHHVAHSLRAFLRNLQAQQDSVDSSRAVVPAVCTHISRDVLGPGGWQMCSENVVVTVAVV